MTIEGVATHAKRHDRTFGEWLLVVGPHPQDVDDVAIGEHLIDKSVLDVDAP